MTDALLKARGLRKVVRDGARHTTLLDGIDLTIEPGSFVALCGPSGSGKSTLLHILGALDPCFEGDVEILGKPIKALSDGARSRLRGSALGFVFQAYHLLGPLSVLDNVRLPSFFAQKSGADDAAELLRQVGLADAPKRRLHTLSGGERQRVAIARALYMGPQVLLCDEPTGNLDTATAGKIFDIFARLHKAGLTLVVVTHDTRLAEHASHVLHLSGGRLHGGP